jgi:pimeloyl-ACP methyl ester carboxylesterase
MKKTIIFIHGVLGNSREYQPLINFLKKNGNFSFYGFNYEERYGNISITELAKKFDVFIKNLNKKNITIIGLSQGGIIASYWLEFLGGNKFCGKCVTICSPFYGTYLAYIIKSPGARELNPKSTFLKKLREKIKKSKVDYYGVWNPLDLAILPGFNATMNAFKKSIKIPSLTHPLTFSD